MQTVVIFGIVCGVVVVIIAIAYYCYRRTSAEEDDEAHIPIVVNSKRSFTTAGTDGGDSSVSGPTYKSKSASGLSANAAGKSPKHGSSNPNQTAGAGEALGGRQSSNQLSNGNGNGATNPAGPPPNAGVPGGQFSPGSVHTGEIARYKIRKVLGEGAYGTVYLATRRISNRADAQVAVKVVPCKNTGEGNEAWKEYTTCLQVKGHPNVIAVLDVFFDTIDASKSPTMVGGQQQHGGGDGQGSAGGVKEKAYLERLGIPYRVVADQYLIIVTNYFPNGTLFDKLVRIPAGQGIPEERIWKWTSQLLQALAYIHNRGVIHRDLKPSNVLISDSEDLALTDFGLSRLLDLDEYAKTRTGTLQYMSPEQVQRRYNIKADTWGIGCLAYGMCTSRVSTATAKMMFREAMKPGFEEMLRSDCVRYSGNLIDFMLLLLTKSSSNRPTAAQAIEEIQNFRNGKYDLVELRQTFAQTGAATSTSLAPQDEK